jgi:ATP-dependent DNA ligase I
VLFEEIARTSGAVAGTAGRLAKIGTLADCLRRLRPDEARVAVHYLSGELPQGTIGVGWASLRDLPPPALTPTLEILEVDEALGRIGSAAGPGSQSVRRQSLAELFGRTTQVERTFLQGLLMGELRQGAQEGVMVEAVARASGLPTSSVRRAAMLSGSLGAVGASALAEGDEGLSRFRLQLFQPVLPMLAQATEGLEAALSRVTPAAVEWKLDGARIQVHRLGGEVRVFTRNLADMTDRVPDVVEAVLALPVEALILDGEAIALRSGGRPHPFSVTMSRFGSRLDIERLRTHVPLSPFFFDCLHLDGEDLLDRSGTERSAALTQRVPEVLRVPREVTGDVHEAERILRAALEAGHEGVMVKSLDAPYEAGRRGAGWLKVKRAHTLDLVVLAVEWGHGRRSGWLSNLHLGARDPSTGGFVMLGKTFKGMTDEMLAWQTKRFLELETGRDAYTVYVRPEQVVEVAFDGVQTSPRYPGGLALRFARVKGYRPDKGPEEADTIEAVRAIHEGRPLTGG